MFKKNLKKKKKIAKQNYILLALLFKRFVYYQRTPVNRVRESRGGGYPVRYGGRTLILLSNMINSLKNTHI